MASVGEWSYGITSEQDAAPFPAGWSSVQAIIREEGTTESYWSARAFALEGWFHLRLRDGGTLAWAGPLLDLASALAEWFDEQLAHYRFYPVEQAVSLGIDVVDGEAAFSTGGRPIGTLEFGMARDAVGAFLQAFSLDLIANVPSIVTVDGFGWVSRFAVER